MARADAVITARLPRQSLTYLLRIGPLPQADDEPRDTAGMAEKLLCQPQRRQDIRPLRLQVERINPAEGHRPPRIVVERQQRGERTPAHGVDIDIGIGKRADAQHISHRLPHDESFDIPQAHPVFTRGNDTVERKHRGIRIVDTPHRSRSLAPGMFQQGTLFEDERKRFNPGNPCHGGRVYRVGRKSLPQPRRDG